MQLTYKEYFECIKPQTEMDIYNRFIFAYCSVHTTWQNNVNGYNILKNTYHTNKDLLMEKIITSKMGLQNNRTRFIYEFTKNYLYDPKEYLKKNNELWVHYAIRLKKNILGLGDTKVRFAIELIYPSTAAVVCLDTHILQIIGRNPKIVLTTKEYVVAEQEYYDKMNQKYNKFMYPYDRHRIWDKKQNKNNPRYWSYCLESSHTTYLLNQLDKISIEMLNLI